MLSCGGIFDFDQATITLQKLSKQAEDPDIWANPDSAQKLMKERESLQHAITQITTLESELEDIATMIELAEAENSPQDLLCAEQEMITLVTKCAKLRLQTLLSNEADNNNCFVEIHAGAGGTEAQDWALMLQRMYIRWAEQNSHKIELLDEISGDEAGIKSCTFKIIGRQSYGWLKTESGVHRLVRISPFDSNARRHTSFASVSMYPEIDDSIDIAINEKDLRIDTYRASGAGGQHVNTTDSAVRITHIPTEVSVQCQNERSQHKNKAQAMSMLKSRLYELELKKREEEAQSKNADKTEIGWGNQIRSYVMHPYQMVKDLRTGFEHSNPQAVLDGNIHKFLEAALSHKVKEK